LHSIQSQFIAYLQTINFESYEKKPNPYSSLGTSTPKGAEISIRLTPFSPNQLREQNKILNDLNLWENDINGLLEFVSKGGDMQLRNLVRDIDLFFHFPRITHSPTSINEAIHSLGLICDQITKYLSDIEVSTKLTPIFVIDTSAIIDCPDITLMVGSINLSGTIFIIPSTTVKELEELKTSKRDETFRRKLTAAIKYLNETIANGDALEGVQLPIGAILRMLAAEPDFSNLPKWLDRNINDDRILAAAIELQRSNPFSTVTLLANDISMQNKAKLARISVNKTPYLSEDAA
jgi:rRNA maturation endonuclease Nob1